jgi:selenocysteine lyase/cysteine desulfurase
MEERLLLATRAEIPALAKDAHRVSHSLGAMPGRARELSARFIDEWESDSIEAWGEHWRPAVRGLGDVVAGVGSVCFDFPGAEAVSRELLRRRVFHDDRPHCGLRVSPHFYTTHDELRALAHAIDEIRR